MSIFCTNCGLLGHGLRNCERPSVSYGIILFQLKNNNIEYVMIRRRESYGMSDFLREKYQLSDPNKLQAMFNSMTIDERNLLKENSIEIVEKIIRPYKIKSKGYPKYNKLMSGIEINGVKYNLMDFLNNCTSNFTSQEWSFPKGKRNKGESDVDCAKREMFEETNIMSDKYVILKQLSYITEYLTGSNNMKYEYHYYLALALTDIELILNPENYEQACEVSKIEWVTLDKALELMRPINENRKNLIKKIDKKLKYQFYGST